MPKRLNEEQSLRVNLAFNADTDKAKQQIADLQKTLSNLLESQSQRADFGFNKEIEKGIDSAITLKSALDAAVNVETGKLDLSKFAKSIDSKQLRQYGNDLANLGPQGQQAFSKITQAILQAEIPLKRQSALLTQFKNTFMNTIRWQFSSSLLHGFMSSVSQAYGYAQDLNQSLNNIRIVTGQSTEQMAAFATQANKAAQSLSATTLDYTDAALIYYQQGLDDEAVKARTDVTVKMANVSRQSAEVVSDQMTAIWNNFAEGSENLEYYADVITALGAATASSSEEIATGLEKFAAVADTVGLSYEYATSALATITATTRQSADTVGTGLRTLFARLEGLKLGETLEDGVDLNKYSKALNDVGVQVLDASGQLKNMDTILDDLASKWSTLGNAQQVALAQTVGGVRQYTNLIALMNNWDFMQQNLETARNSEGVLNEQQKIYAEGWEAARDRVKAALQDIYQKILDDDGFIKLLNIGEQVVHIISNIIDSLGGVKGTVLLIGSILTTMYQKEISQGLTNFWDNLGLRIGKTKDKLEEYKKSAVQGMIDVIPAADQTTAGLANYSSYENQAEVQSIYLAKQKELIETNSSLSAIDEKRMQYYMQINDELSEQQREMADIYDKEERANEFVQERLQQKFNNSNKERYKKILGELQQEEEAPIYNDEKVKQLEKELDLILQQRENSKSIVSELQDQKKEYNALLDLQKNINTLSKNENNLDFEDWSKKISEIAPEFEDILQSATGWEDAQSRIAARLEEVKNSTQITTDQFRELALQSGYTESEIDEMLTDMDGLGIAYADLLRKQLQSKEFVLKTKEAFKEMSGEIPTISQGLTEMSSSLMSVGAALSAWSKLSDLWSEDTSIGQKLIIVITTITSTIAAYTKVQKALETIKTVIHAKTKLVNKAVSDNTQETVKNNAAQSNNTKLRQQNVNATDQQSNSLNKQNLQLKEGGKSATGFAQKIGGAVKSVGALGAVLAIVIAALYVYFGITNKIANKEAESAQKAADAAKKLLDKKEEEISKNKQLVESYQLIYNSYLKTGQATEELKNKTLEVAKAYDIAGASVLAAQGKFEELNKLILQAQGQEAKEEAKAAQMSASASVAAYDKNLRAKYNNVTGVGDFLKKGFNGYTNVGYDILGRTRGTATNLDFTNYWQDLGFNKKNKITLDKLREWEGSKDFEHITYLGGDRNNGKLQIYNDDTAQDWLAAYEEVEALIQHLQEEGLEDSTVLKSSFYTTLLDHYNLMSESVDEIREAVEIETQATIKNIAAQKLLNQEYDKGISSQEDFYKYRQDIIDSLPEGTENAEEKVDEYLNSLEQFSGFMSAQNLIKDFAKTTKFTEAELVEFYDSIDEKQKYLFSRLHIASATSFEDLQKELVSLSNTAEENFINSQLNAIKEAKEKLKDGMAAEDYTEFFDLSGIEWGIDGIISKLQFLSMSYEQQQNYINEIEKEKAQERLKITNDEIDDRIYQSELLQNEIAKVQEQFDSKRPEDMNDEVYTSMMQGLSSRILELQAEKELIDAETETIKADYDNYYMDLALSAQSVFEFAENYKDLARNSEQYSLVLEAVANQSIQSATTLHDLEAAINDNAMMSSLDDEKYKLNYNIVSDALINMASQYDHCALEIQNYKDALDNAKGSLITVNEGEQTVTYTREEYIQATERALRATIQIGEAAKKYGIDAADAETQAKQLAEAYGYDEESAARLAIANRRLNKGVKTLNENFEDWKKILTQSDHTSMDYADTLNDALNVVADLTGAIDADAISFDFLNNTTEEGKKHLKLLEEAAQGSEKAINLLGLAVAEDTVNMLDLNDVISTLNKNGLYSVTEMVDETAQLFSFSANEFEFWKSSVLNGIAELEQGVQNGAIAAGDSVAAMDAQWVDSLNKMAMATGMSVEEMNSLLNQLGVQAKVDVKTVKKKMEIPTTLEYSEIVGTTPYSYEIPDTSAEGGTRTVKGSRPIIKTAVVPGPVESYEGYEQVAQISTVDNPIEPQITYTGTAGSGSTPRGGGGGISPSSKASSGAKSSGGSSSSRSQKDKKDPIDEKERYHLINSQIEQQTYTVERLSKMKDRAYGKSKMKLYDQELQALADIGAMYKEHLNQSTEYLKQDRALIESMGADVSDIDGSILNYDQLIAEHVNAYNEWVEAYNRGEIEEDSFKQAEEQYQAFQDALEQYEETLNIHQDDLDKFVDNYLERYDLMAAKNAEALELRIDYDDSVLEFLDKLLERMDSWNKSPFNATDKMANLNERTGSLISKNDDLNKGIDSVLQHYLRDGLDEFGNILNKSDAEISTIIDHYKSNTLSPEELELLAKMPAEELEALQGFADQLQENSDALIQTVDDVVTTVREAFDTTKEEMEEAERPLHQAAEALDNYSQIIDIVGKDYLGISTDMMAAMGQMNQSILHTTTAIKREEMETLAAERDQVQALMDSAIENNNLELAEKYRQQLKGINDDVDSATEAFHQAWRDELSGIREIYEQMIDQVKDDMLDTFAGPDNTWRELKDSFDYAKEAADRFVPEYKEIYELSKLNRDINKSIDDTDNIKNKQALRDLQLELNQLEENSGKISQYDLDNARRRYELELARLALEESRAMKDTVRLSKDSEGNWSYIYTANEEDVANAEQNYEDKLYAMQEANTQYINDLQDQIIAAEEAYANKVAEIMKDNTLTEEQRQALLLAARAQFDDTMDYYGGELDKAMDENKRLYDDDWTWYANYTQRKAELEQDITDSNKEHLGYRLGDTENFITNFNDTLLGSKTGFDNFQGYSDAVQNGVNENTNHMNQDFQLWQNNTEAAMQGAGTSVGTFGHDMIVGGERVEDFLAKMQEAGYGADDYSTDLNGLSSEITQTYIPSTQAAKESVWLMAKSGQADFDALTIAAEDWRKEYVQQIDDPDKGILKKNNDVYESILNIKEIATELDGTEIHIGWDISEPNLPEIPTDYTIGIHYEVDPVATGPSGSQGGGTSDTTNKLSSSNDGNDNVRVRWGQSSTQHWGINKSGKEIPGTRESHSWDHYNNNNSNSQMFCRICGYTKSANTVNFSQEDAMALNKRMYGFATGGYTGDFGNPNQGKLAVLHSKELVLNENDTRNILSAVDMVRGFSDAIERYAFGSQYAVGNLSAATGSAIGGSETLEQTVHITAEFPAAQNRGEIEAAFETLINQASQYANRKKI